MTARPLVRGTIAAPCATLGLAALVGGCASGAELAAKLAESSTPAQLPRVVACYERAFEAAGFAGEHVVVLDFTVAGDSFAISDVVVRDTSTTSGPAAGPDFAPCVTAALDASSFAGSSFRPGHDVKVVGMRLAFRDATAAARAAAVREQGRMLVGPRADRCLGLYRYEPPRDAAELFSELDEMQRKAARLKASEPDGHARALQRAFDTALELRERLTRDAAEEGLAKESRARIHEAVARAERSARELATTLGCEVPFD